MSRTSKPAAATTEAPTEASIEGPSEGFAVNLREIPAVVALNCLIGAVVALAGFPSSPVPDSLLQNLARAREAYVDALKDPVLLPSSPSHPASAYDDAWIKAAFEGLNEQLKDRFAALDSAIEGLTKSVTEIPSVDLSAIEERLAALEADRSAVLAAIEGRILTLDAWQDPAVAQAAADQA